MSLPSSSCSLSSNSLHWSQFRSELQLKSELYQIRLSSQADEIHKLKQRWRSKQQKLGKLKEEKRKLKEKLEILHRANKAEQSDHSNKQENLTKEIMEEGVEQLKREWSQSDFQHNLMRIKLERTGNQQKVEWKVRKMLKTNRRKELNQALNELQKTVRERQVEVTEEVKQVTREFKRLLDEVNTRIQAMEAENLTEEQRKFSEAIKEKLFWARKLEQTANKLTEKRETKEIQKRAQNSEKTVSERFQQEALNYLTYECSKCKQRDLGNLEGIMADFAVMLQVIEQVPPGK
jgi:hypothetical protein